MPVHLRAPESRAGGPDGKGWNRLSLNAHMGQPTDRCALRPRTYAALVESRDTRRAQWGAGFAACINSGACGRCSVLNAQSTSFSTWDGDDGKVLVRIQQRAIANDLIAGGPPARLHLMQDASAGWDSRSVRLTWEELTRLAGWRIGRQHQDEHSAGFWLVKEGGDDVA